MFAILDVQKLNLALLIKIQTVVGQDRLLIRWLICRYSSLTEKRQMRWLKVTASIGRYQRMALICRSCLNLMIIVLLIFALSESSSSESNFTTMDNLMSAPLIVNNATINEMSPACGCHRNTVLVGFKSIG